MMIYLRSFLLFVCCSLFTKLHAQEPKGYFSMVHPIASIQKGITTFNFKNSYTVGFPFGIHIPVTKKFGYSLELVPFINADSITSKVNNVWLHPGVYVNLPHKFKTFARAAFETSGRYGYTIILSRPIYTRNKSAIYTSIPMGMRFGNAKGTSSSIAFLIGYAF